MIKKYVFKTPFPTEAVVKDIEPEKDKPPFFETDDNGSFKYTFSENDIVCGLGEQIRGINKRGWQYKNWNYDNPNHHEDTRSLYGSHNHYRKTSTIWNATRILPWTGSTSPT